MQSYPRRRRHLHADRHLRDRHRPELRAGAGAEPGVERAGVAAAGGAGAGRDGAEEIDRDPRDRRADLARRPLRQPVLSNYATINLKDELARLPGVGNVNVFGAGQYAMRIWLDPRQAAGARPDAQDVMQALQQQNQQVTAGQVGMPPAPQAQAFQYTVNVAGRLDDAASSRTSSSRPATPATITRVRDVGRVELGAQTYSQVFTLDGKPAAGIADLPVAGRQRARTSASEVDRQDGGAGARSFRPGLSTASRSTPPSSSTPRSTRSTRR